MLKMPEPDQGIIARRHEIAAARAIVPGEDVIVDGDGLAHLCCGSAGTYNILQPEIAGQLGNRKAAALQAPDADVIATGNIGCAMQIGQRTAIPVVHTVELLDWATGGPVPPALSAHQEGSIS